MIITGEAMVALKCHMLLEQRNFEGVTILVETNHQKLPFSKEWPKLEQAKAICDVIIAAEKRLSNGLMDYYGMIRVKTLGDVVLDDFLKLMNLLDGRLNTFPCSQEAARCALQGWYILSKPLLKSTYDLAVSASMRSGLDQGVGGSGLGGRGNSQREGGVIASQGIFGGAAGGSGGGGGGGSGGGVLFGGKSYVSDCRFGSFRSGGGIRIDGGEASGGGRDGGYGGGDKGKGKRQFEPLMICKYCYSRSERETEYNELCFKCNRVPELVAVSPVEKGEEISQLGLPKDSSFNRKEQSSVGNVGRGSEDVVVVISDDESDGDEESVTMAQTAKVWLVNGKRVKLIPFKKKKN